MKKLLLALIFSLATFSQVFALSENPSSVVVQYPSGFTLGNITYTDCTVPGSKDCVLTNNGGNLTLYKNVNGSLSTFYQAPAWSNDTDILGVKSDFLLPNGFLQQTVGDGTYNILKTSGLMNVQAIEYGKWKINNVYFCLYDRGVMTTNDSYPLARKLIVGAYSSSSSYVCPGTYSGFNLADFYGANPYVAPTPESSTGTVTQTSSGSVLLTLTPTALTTDMVKLGYIESLGGVYVTNNFSKIQDLVVYAILIPIFIFWIFPKMIRFLFSLFL